MPLLSKADGVRLKSGFKHKKQGLKSQAGLSLIETCMFLVVVGLLVVAAIALYDYQQEFLKVQRNADLMETAQNSLKNYLDQHGQLPCPASRVAPPDSALFGVSIGADCTTAAVNPTGGILADTISIDNTLGGIDAVTGNIIPDVDPVTGTARKIRIGTLPVRTLGLPDKDIVDVYGNRFIYAVTEDMAMPSAASPTPWNRKKGVISIHDTAGNSATSSKAGNAVFVLLSPGQDIRGAFNLEGAQAASCAASGLSKNNCDDDDVFVNTTQKSYKIGGSHGYTYSMNFMVNPTMDGGMHTSPPSYGWTSSGPTCVSTCGPTVLPRTIKCINKSTGLQELDESKCDASSKPAPTVTCSQTCAWVADNYDQCNQQCGTRTVVCKNNANPPRTLTDNGNPGDPCTTYDPNPKPPTTQDCSLVAGCSYVWDTHEWGECSDQCSGTHARDVFCIDSVSKATVDDSKCNPADKPKNSEACGDSSLDVCKPPCDPATDPDGCKPAPPVCPTVEGQTQCPTDSCFFWVSGIAGGDHTDVTHSVAIDKIGDEQYTYEVKNDKDGITYTAGSNLVGAGEYPDVYGTQAHPGPFNRAANGTFDSIALGANTHLIVYSDKNFGGSVLFDQTGPLVLLNKQYKTNSWYPGFLKDDWSHTLPSEWFSQFTPNTRHYTDDETTLWAWSEDPAFNTDFSSLFPVLPDPDGTSIKVICDATPIDGECNNSLPDACLKGRWHDLPDDSNYYYWQCDSANGGVSSPTCKAPKVSYRWDAPDFTTCPTQCGASILTRTVTCLRNGDDAPVDDSNCDPDTRPDVNKTCGSDETQCPACEAVNPKVDVYFLADNTSSMQSAINLVNAGAHDILNRITGGDSRFTGLDIQFAVGSYGSDPSEGNVGYSLTGAPYSTTSSHYRLLQPLTASVDDTVTALNQWVAVGGGDIPQGQFFAMKQLASATSTPEGLTGWRSGATHILVWMGDSPGHTETVSVADAARALIDNQISVIALKAPSSDAMPGCSPADINCHGQADNIVNASSSNGGGIITDIAGMDTNALADAIVNNVYSVASKTCPVECDKTPAMRLCSNSYYVHNTPWHNGDVDLTLCAEGNTYTEPLTQTARCYDPVSHMYHAECGIQLSKTCQPSNAACKVYTTASTTQPASDTASGCLHGTYADDADDTANHLFKWTCEGIGLGATDVDCSSPIAQPTDPVCGGANGHHYADADGVNAAGLCGNDTTPSPATVSGNGPWSWTCAGIYGSTATPVNCSADQAIDGVCDNSTLNGCSYGTLDDVVDDSSSYLWHCKGTGGGNDDNACSMPKPDCGSAKDGQYVDLATLQSGPLCATGTASIISGDGSSGNPWSWTCGDGTTTSGTCTATKNACTAPGAGTKNIDIMFLADNTGSMQSVIDSVQHKASDILNTIANTTDPRYSGVSVQFGVARYWSDPVEIIHGDRCCKDYALDGDGLCHNTHNYADTQPTGNACVGTGNQPASSSDNDYYYYELQQPFTATTSLITAALGNWKAGGADVGENGRSGGDGPEGEFNAMKRLVESPYTGWRDDAVHILIWMGDAPAHTETVPLNDAGGKTGVINLLKSKNIHVIALNAGALDGFENTDHTDQQATVITTATGGTLNAISGGKDNAIATTIINNVQNITDNICGTPTGITCGSAAGTTAVSTAPTDHLCSDDSTPSVNDDGTNFTWTCAGAPATCSVPKLINGACGSANGQSYRDADAASLTGTQLCDNGDASVISPGAGDPTTITWTCTGTDTAHPLSCSANRIMDGVCGGANGHTYSDDVGLKAAGLCSDGSNQVISGDGSSASPWSWSCPGIHGGNPASCSASKDVCTDSVSNTKNVDIIFLADNTGSMGGYIASIKAKAADILNSLHNSTDPRFAGVSMQFGVARYWGDPYEAMSCPGGYSLTKNGSSYLCIPITGGAPTSPTPSAPQLSTTDHDNYYELQQNLVYTDNITPITNAINNWAANGGNDLPEGQFNAMKRLAESSTTGWRDNAGHILIWMGDAYAHEESVTKAQTIAALEARGIHVIALKIGADSVTTSIDAFSQAGDIVSQTNGTIDNITGASNDDIANTIINNVLNVTEHICNGVVTHESYTYHWSITADYLNACPTQCSTSVQSRTVACMRNDDVAVADSFCSGAGVKPATTRTCAGDSSLCSTTNPGVCGTANGGAFDSASSLNAAQLCSQGTPDPASPAGAGPWGWVCHSNDGGADSPTCTADQAGQTEDTSQCKIYSSTYASQPATNDATGCTSGHFSESADSDTAFKWVCVTPPGSCNSPGGCPGMTAFVSYCHANKAP